MFNSKILVTAVVLVFGFSVAVPSFAATSTRQSAIERRNARIRRTLLSNQSSIQGISTSKEAMSQCTKDDWECTTSECVGGYQRVSCKLNNSNCWGAQLPSAKVQSCVKQLTPQEQQAAQKVQEASILRIYQKLLNIQKQNDQIVSLFSGTTAIQLFQLSSQFSEIVSEFKVYVYKAQIGEILPSDFLMIQDILQSAGNISDRILAIAEAAKSLSQQQNYQYRMQQIQQQNLMNQQNAEYCTQLKNQLTIDLAIRGGAFSTGGNNSVTEQLYQAGCR